MSYRITARASVATGIVAVVAAATMLTSVSSQVSQTKRRAFSDSASSVAYNSRRPTLAEIDRNIEPAGDLGRRAPISEADPDVRQSFGTALPPVINHVNTSQKVIFVTIDDGYTRDPRVLRLLAETHIPVTAFLIDQTAKPGLTYWRKLQDLGASFEDHTLDHKDLRKMNFDQQVKEICQTADDFAIYFGSRPTLMRPPDGFYNDSVRAAVRRCGLGPLVMWAGSMNFGKLALARGKLHNGDIILMHWRPDLFDNLTNLINIVRNQGFAFGKLESYLAEPDYKVSVPPPSPKPHVQPTAYATAEPTQNPATDTSTTTPTADPTH
ncbi:MAG: polysaccharide deacetylase family protein [Actinomycetota bacterium]